MATRSTSFTARRPLLALAALLAAATLAAAAPIPLLGTGNAVACPAGASDCGG